MGTIKELEELTASEIAIRANAIKDNSIFCVYQLADMYVNGDLHVVDGEYTDATIKDAFVCGYNLALKNIYVNKP